MSAQAFCAVPDVTLPEQQAIYRYFNGNRGLFLHYRSVSVAQLRQELPLLHQAVALQRWAEVRQMAHQIKPVLRLVGQEACAALMQTLEHAAARQDAATLQQSWAHLHPQLTQVLEAAASNTA